MTNIKKHRHLPDNNKTNNETHPKAKPVTLHYLRKIRRQKKISRETVARRLGIDVAAVKDLEDESTDITLSVLHEWQKTLDVPLEQLFVEQEGVISAPPKKYAQLVGLMKTAILISRQSRQVSVTNMVHNLINQLLEIMPELRRTMMQYSTDLPRQPEDYDVEFMNSCLDKMIADYSR